MIDNSVVEKVHAFRVFVDGASKIVSAFEESSGFTIVPVLYSPRRYINARSIDSIYTVLRELGIVDKLAVVPFSGGGDIDEAYILATYLQDLAREKLVFYIPRYAKSATTLLALAGDEVVLLPVAELGPVDPVIYDSHIDRYIPLQSILEILDLLSQKGLTSELAKAILERIPVVELGDYKMAVEHNAELCGRVLARRMYRENPEKAGEIANKLVSYKQHSAAITLKDLLDLGVKARKAAGHEAEYLWRIHELWVEKIIEYEELLPPEAIEPVEFKLGRGVVFTVAPSDLIQ
ncbi:MAG: SDH family Clp fold serine proteinase [Desulfurococcaceae archaeon]